MATQLLKYSAFTSGRFFSSWASVPTNNRKVAARNMTTVIFSEPATRSSSQLCSARVAEAASRRGVVSDGRGIVPVAMAVCP